MAVWKLEDVGGIWETVCKMTRKRSIWIGAAVFAAVYLSLRIFWIDGDPGIPAIWEYGYNCTDEGYYLDGGKEKFLWGQFVDLPRNEAFTYGFSPGTHYLSYFAHLIFGLSDWAWRIPFLAIAFVSWMSLYFFLARRNGGFIACLATSSVPMLIAYERTASNDVLIGSLCVLAYVVGAGARLWRLCLSAVIISLVVLVKPSVWVLLPIVLAGVLETRKVKSAWLDAGIFLALSICTIFVLKLCVALAVLPDAQNAGVSIFEIVRRTTTHYPLPSLFAFSSHFRGLSAFPRDPSYALLAVSTTFAVILPAIMAMRAVYMKRWNARTLLFFAQLAYVAAINVMNTQYTHYFIPSLMTVPLLIHASQEELSEGQKESDIRPWNVLWKLLFVLAVGAVALLFLSAVTTSITSTQCVYSRIYNFPEKNVWGLTGQYMFLAIFGLVGSVCLCSGFRHIKQRVIFWMLAAFVISSVTLACYPSFRMSSYLHQSGSHAFAPLSLIFLSSAILYVAIFAYERQLPWKTILAPYLMVSVILCYLFTPNWRQSAVELMRPAKYLQRDIAQDIARRIPKEAIVIGERANQILMSQPIRTATTFASNSDPIPVIQSILAVEPEAKLYALIDSQHAYNLKHYNEHANEFRLEHITTYSLPSFGDGKLAKVYLCKIWKAQ